MEYINYINKNLKKQVLVGSKCLVVSEKNAQKLPPPSTIERVLFSENKD